MMKWNDKFYHSLDFYLKERFGRKIYKLSLNGGMSCPNRDGKLDTRGCIFCSAGGSGDFATSARLSIGKQIEAAKSLVASKTKEDAYIAYFQAYTNTYAPVEYLENIFMQAISHKDIVALSIATRPDCLADEVIELLVKLNKIKPVFIELGLQTINEESARYIRRGYSLNIYDDAIKRLNMAGIEVIVHMIIGLPNEDINDMLATAKHIAKSKAKGIKLQLLHILENTDLANDYRNNKFSTLSFEEYIDIIITILEILPPDMVIHRLTGDGPKDLLIAPLWSKDKKRVLNEINKQLKARNTYQGAKYHLERN
ncbi:MAG: TIGR01212 family radical SAM protein [Lachnospira sp.]|nr:TIGR01212 family radical SAM protein [Lachnospira sp.]